VGRERERVRREREMRGRGAQAGRDGARPHAALFSKNSAAPDRTISTRPPTVHPLDITMSHVCTI
jgi:hypothetical protein